MSHRGIVRPILFRLDPERAHGIAMAGLTAVAHMPPVGALADGACGSMTNG